MLLKSNAAYPQWGKCNVNVHKCSSEISNHLHTLMQSKMETKKTIINRTLCWKICLVDNNQKIYTEAKFSKSWYSKTFQKDVWHQKRIEKGSLEL